MDRRSSVMLWGMRFFWSGVLLLVWSGVAWGGAWTKSLGEAYVKLDQGFFLSDSFTNSDGIVVGGADYLGITTSLYFEVGVFDRVQLQGLIPYTIGINAFDQGPDTMRAGGGDLLVALQAAPPFWQQIPLAARLELKVPLYDVGAGSAPPTATNDFPALGDGQLDVTLLLLGGAGFDPLPLYAWAELGYRFRTESFIGEGPPDERVFKDSLVWLAQAGWTFYRDMVLALNCVGVVALAGDELTKSYVTLGPALFLPVFRGLAIEARFDPVVYARNSAQGYGFGFGLSYSR